MWDDCEAGEGTACDDLYWASDSQTAYEAFAATCGLRTTGGEVCTNEVMSRPSSSD